MSMKVVKPGLLTTVQDTGRTGYQKYGVLGSGAMDTISLRIANLLAGNQEKEAGLEITLMGPGPSFEFSEPAVIAVTGADFALHINGEPAPLWKPVLIKENSVVSFGPCKMGSRAYLAPVRIGNPQSIGISDLHQPDFGDAVTVREGEVPVFWACGVTPQAVIMEAKPDIVITHSPGHMLITDIRNESLAVL